MTLACVYAFAAFANAWATRGRHFGWMALSAVIALAVMWWGMPVWGAAAALIGQIIGEAVNLGGIIYSLQRSLASNKVSLAGGTQISPDSAL